VNKRGTPANLVASHPGNTNALRYGVHSAKFICDLATDIEEELFGESGFSPIQRVAAHEVATNLAILQRIDLDLSERGIVDKKGEPRYLLGHRVRISREMERWSAHLATVRNAGDDSGDGITADTSTLLRELKSIALGHDRRARPSDRLAAIELLLKHGAEDGMRLADLDREIETLAQEIERSRASHAETDG
jgi:hypothetical protein